MALKLLLDNTSVKTLSRSVRWINLSQIVPITEQLSVAFEEWSQLSLMKASQIKIPDLSFRANKTLFTKKPQQTKA